MFIDKDKCSGCRQCIPFCPMEAICADGKAFINPDRCTECGVCFRAGVCAKGAIIQDQLQWPRAIRAQFSNVLFVHKDIPIEGRGTEEMKTNDVTNRFGEDEVGIGIELGRPGVGTNFDDLEKITTTLAGLNTRFAQDNPTTHLIDVKTGKLLEEMECVRWEFVTSAIVECIIKKEDLKDLMAELRKTAEGINTVFSLDLIFKDTKNYKSVVDDLGIEVRPNAKVNVGMATA